MLYRMRYTLKIIADLIVNSIKMRFRAVMQNPQYIREFQQIVATLAKLTKDYCLIKISKERVQLIANQEFGTAAPLVWIDIDVALYFEEYLVESAYAHSPHIMLSFSAMDLNRALTVLRNSARKCKIKLNNIQFPCLTLESEVATQNSDKPRYMNHNVPVDVVPNSDWPIYDLPGAPPAQLIVNISAIRQMRGLLDKLKNLSPNVVFHATSVGELNLISEAEMSTITTRYRRLFVRVMRQGRENPEVDGSKSALEVSCSIDCRKAAHFFNALQIPSEELSCAIDDGRVVHLQINVREGVVVNSILPAVCV